FRRRFEVQLGAHPLPSVRTCNQRLSDRTDIATGLEAICGRLIVMEPLKTRRLGNPLRRARLLLHPAVTSGVGSGPALRFDRRIHEARRFRYRLGSLLGGDARSAKGEPVGQITHTRRCLEWNKVESGEIGRTYLHAGNAPLQHLGVAGSNWSVERAL